MPSDAAVSCQDWTKIKPAVGQTLCVKGIVVQSQVVDNNFVMKFDETAQSIYGVSHNAYYYGIDGHCSQITGEVKQDATGRFFIEADLPDQVTECAP